MELRRYWQIILRYWWVVLIFTLAGVFLAYTTYKSTTANYQAAFVVNIQRDLPPATQANTGYQDFFDYYRSISAEYVLDDYTQIVKGSLFLTDVVDSLKSTPYPLSADDLKGAFDVERKHRELTFTVRADTIEKNLVLVKALSQNMDKNAGKYLARGDERLYSAKIIDMPNTATYNSGRNLLLASIRAIIGIILGVGLAFLLNYLDTTLRSKADFEEVLDLPIIGTIPGKPMFGGSRGSNNSTPPGVSQGEPERQEARR